MAAQTAPNAAPEISISGSMISQCVPLSASAIRMTPRPET